MLEALISSKTRIKLMLKFFLNSNASGYLRGLEHEFKESSNGIRIELNRFEKSGMIESYSVGNKKYFKANTEHPLFNEIHNIVLKYVGFDKIIESIISRLGKVEKVFVVGDFARGIDSHVIDLVLVGDIDKNYFITLVEKAERAIGRKIKYVMYKSMNEVDLALFSVEPLLLWEDKENERN